jgi:hypothetical protein
MQSPDSRLVELQNFFSDPEVLSHLQARLYNVVVLSESVLKL